MAKSGKSASTGKAPAFLGVVSVPERFNRSGIQFTRQLTIVDCANLSDEQVAAIVGERMLRVTTHEKDPSDSEALEASKELGKQAEAGHKDYLRSRMASPRKPDEDGAKSPRRSGAGIP